MKTIKSLTEAELPKLPEVWSWTKLEMLTDLYSGKAFKKSEYSESGIRLFQIANVSFGYASWDNLSYLPYSYSEEYPELVLNSGDILMALNRPILNDKLKIALLKRDDVPAILYQRVGRFDFYENKIKTYFFYYAQSLFFIDYLKSSMQGVDQPFINKPKLLQIPFPLPPLPEQRAIVSKIELLFSELDNGIANIKLAQEQLKVYRQAVLKKAFEGELTKKWREQQTDLPDAGDLLEQITKEREETVTTSGRIVKDVKSLTDTELADLPKIPEGWKWVKLPELCNLIGGVTKGRKLEGKKTISLPYLRVANVQDGYLNLSEIKFIDVLEGDLEKYRLIEGDILYTEGGDKDKLGRGTIWKGQIENCIHQNHIFRARPYSSNLVSSYIGYFSQTKAAKNYFFKNAKQTVNLASINLTVLSNLPFPLCSLLEQQAIVQEIETRLSVCDKIEQDIKENLEKAEALRQSILKKAFEGKLLNERELAEVRGAEDWEPAEVLLERIRTERARK
ncbi:MAG: restriction endonuclease subunit S [Candidatus Cloacimonetes bacterium]|nr:restriction endonuclease subunit S [Candidatus Cloacimonadota bacterium]